jgi:hypothetical protein
MTITRSPGEPEETADVQPPCHYAPPSVTYLGTLHELTQGGTSGPNDSVGGAGNVGSLS